MVGLWLALAPAASALAQKADQPRPGSVHPSEVSRAMGTRSTLPIGWIVVAAGVVLVVLSLASLVRWWRTRRLKPHPLQLFSRLAKETGLTPRDRLLLYRIAVHEKLPTPLTLMLSPRTLRHHAKAYFTELPPWRRRRSRARLAQIRRSLFHGHGSTIAAAKLAQTG